MAELSKIARNSISAQEVMFRIAKRDHGLTTARLAQLLGAFTQAVSPDSPGGVHITPSERATLADIYQRLAARKIA